MAVRKLVIVGMLAALLAAPVQAGEIEADPSPAAMEFVGQFSDDHLSGMLSRIGARTETMMMLGQVNGGLAEEVFNTEIDAAVERHGDEWQRNMALSWMPLMTDEELASLTAEGADSPYADEYVAKRADAGQNMQTRSRELFEEILGEVVANTFTTMQAAAGDG